MATIRENFWADNVKFWDVPTDKWEAVFDVNVKAPFMLAKAAVPHMIAGGWGRIVNVTTSLDTMIRPAWTPYGPSKAALEASSANWAGDLDGTGVTVNVLIPGGPADTPFVTLASQPDRSRLIQPGEDGAADPVAAVRRIRRRQRPPVRRQRLEPGYCRGPGGGGGVRADRVEGLRTAGRLATRARVRPIRGNEPGRKSPMIETRGVVHFTIPVTDPERSEKFYREVLGLETVQVVPPIGMVFMKSGEDHVILTRSKTPVDPNPGNDFLIHHAFRVDLDAYDDAKRQLAEHGIEIIFEEERHEGVFHGRQCYFHDPDRNVLEIIALEKIGEGFGDAARQPGFSPFSSKEAG